MLHQQMQQPWHQFQPWLQQMHQMHQHQQMHQMHQHQHKQRQHLLALGAVTLFQRLYKEHSEKSLQRLNLQLHTLVEDGPGILESDVPFALIRINGVGSINVKCQNVNIEMCAFTIL